MQNVAAFEREATLKLDSVNSVKYLNSNSEYLAPTTIGPYMNKSSAVAVQIMC